jgi:hypothetical protein
MAGDPFLDIAPVTQTIAGLTVTGVSLRRVAALMVQFPVLAGMFKGGGVDASNLMEAGPDVVTAVIAAAAGRTGDKAAEKKIDDLALGTQAELLLAAVRATFPDGVDPFKDRLLQLASLLTVTSAAGGDVAEASPEQSSS